MDRGFAYDGRQRVFNSFIAGAMLAITVFPFTPFDGPGLRGLISCGEFMVIGGILGVWNNQRAERLRARRRNREVKNGPFDAHNPHAHRRNRHIGRPGSD